MQRILIVNLTRLGDLIQSTVMIEGLKELYPDSDLTLFANKAFAGICGYIPFINKVKLFDIKKFEPALTGKEISLVEVYLYIESVLDELKGEQYDLVINLTHSRLSAMVSNYIRPKEVIGLYATDFGDRQIKGPWITYFCNLVINREYNRFNLVDIYAKSIGCSLKGKYVHLDCPDSIEDITKKFIDEYCIKADDFVVGFQPGSSRTDRRWPTSSFSRLANSLIRGIGARIILFGTSAEDEEGKEIAKGVTEGICINLVGKTDISKLIGVLRRVDVLVTNDTGTMHIAAALGRKVIALFFAHALAHETGPYGEGHIIVQADIACSPCSHHVNCNNMVCKEYITPEDIYKLISYIRNGKKTLKNYISGEEGHFQKVSVLSPVFDRDGLYECFPLNRRALKERDLIGMVYREVFKVLLKQDIPFWEDPCAAEQWIADASAYIIEKISLHFECRTSSGFISDIIQRRRYFSALSKKADRGIKASIDITCYYNKRPIDIESIKSAGAAMESLDKEIEEMGYVSSCLRPLVQVFLFGKENLEGEDIMILASSTLALYKSLYIGSFLMEKVIGKVCDNMQD